MQPRGGQTLKQPNLTSFKFGNMLEENLVQIAGVIDAAEAQMLRQCGVRYLGFPFRLPVHREDLTEQAAAAIIRSLAPPVFGVLITYLREAAEIAALCHALRARIVQLHGDIDREELKRLKTLDPNLTVIKSLVVGMREPKALEATPTGAVAVRRCVHHRHLRSEDRRIGRHRQDSRLAREQAPGGACRSTGHSRRRTHAGERQERDSGSTAGRSRLPHRRRRLHRPQEP